MAQLIDTAGSARQLAEGLLRPGRGKPALVVSIAGGRTEPFVDVAHIESELDGLCDVYILAHGDASWAFAAGLPDGRQVFGGASRVYATDLHWVRDQYSSPLRFAYSTADGRQVAGQLVEDALTAVYRDRQRGNQSVVGRVEASGRVLGVRGGRALVELASGGGRMPATIQPELVTPGVAAEQMFVSGQRVLGLYDAEANRLDVDDSVATPQTAFADIGVGDGLLARVLKIGDKYVTVSTFPGCEQRISVDEFEDEPSIGRLVTVGEVVVVETQEMADGVPTRVSLLPSNFAELARPVAILPGGPAWLAPEQVGAPAPTETEQPTDARSGELPDDEPVIDPSDPEAPLLAETSALRRRLRVAERDLTVLGQQLAAAKTTARTLKQDARELRGELDAVRANRLSGAARYFDDPWEQFDYEVYVTWVQRTTAADKRERPWRRPCCGPNFLETLESTEGVERSKIIEVVADLVSGHADRLPGRAMHQLRSGSGGNDPPVTRADGSTCWRISLQHKSPSARRLHFWRLPDGSVELSSVRLHDDMRP